MAKRVRSKGVGEIRAFAISVLVLLLPTVFCFAGAEAIFGEGTLPATGIKIAAFFFFMWLSSKIYGELRAQYKKELAEWENQQWLAMEEAQKKEEEEEQRIAAAQKAQEERDKLASHYEYFSLRELSGMPADLIMGDDLTPIYRVADESENKPPLVCYIVSDNAQCYHRRDCTYAANGKPYNVYKDRSAFANKTPCYYCMPGRLPNDTWYKIYLEDYEECISHGIKPRM